MLKQKTLTVFFIKDHVFFPSILLIVSYHMKHVVLKKYWSIYTFQILNVISYYVLLALYCILVDCSCVYLFLNRLYAMTTWKGLFLITFYTHRFRCKLQQQPLSPSILTSSLWFLAIWCAAGKSLLQHLSLWCVFSTWVYLVGSLWWDWSVA